MSAIMAFKVDENTIKVAGLCNKEFSCLKGPREDLCKVKRCVDGKVHFVECLSGDLCHYKKDFGGSSYCDCPVRKVLFKKYGV